MLYNTARKCLPTVLLGTIGRQSIKLHKGRMAQNHRNWRKRNCLYSCRG